jgi:hypothetical protein
MTAMISATVGGSAGYRRPLLRGMLKIKSIEPWTILLDGRQA